MPSIGAPEILSDALELDRLSPQITYDLALKIMTGMKVERLKTQHPAKGFLGKCDFEDLPVSPEFSTQMKKSVTHLVGCVRDYEGALDEDLIIGLMLENHFADLPAPLCPKQLNRECNGVFLFFVAVP